MKQNRLKKEYRSNASKLHKLTGDTLRNSKIFGAYRIYQEYPVNRINDKFPNGRAKYDWVILDLSIVIEVMGEQHYGPVKFGGISDEEAESNFRKQLKIDEEKKQAAIDAGFTYVALKYSEPITEELILNKL